MRHVYVIVSALAFVACGPSAQHHGDDDGSGGTDANADAPTPLPHTVSGISIDPLNTTLQLGLNAPAQQAFTVTAQYADGTTEDITQTATWTVANPAVGTFTTPPTLDVPGFTVATAVSSKLTASYMGVDGIAQITVVATRPEDFFFILPYNDTVNNPATQPLTFATAVPALDVFMLMDVTGSMGGEIVNLKSALTSTVVPGVQAAVANSQFGVGAFADFVSGNSYGTTNCHSSGTTWDQPFKLFTPITNSTTTVQTAVNGLSNGATPVGCGGDGPESAIEGIYQSATGAGITGPSPNSVTAAPIGWRAGTMPVVLAISDAQTHGKNEATNTCSGTNFSYNASVSATAHSRDEAKAALAGICARVIGIASTPQTDPQCDSRSYMTDFSTTTGARVPPAAWDFTGTRPAGCAANQCCTKINGAGEAPDGDGLCPLVFQIASDGTGISTSVVTGIQMLTRFATFDVTHTSMGVATDVDGNALPNGHTTADFLKAITPTGSTVPAPPPVITPPTFDATNFHNVTPGTQIKFAVDAYNDFVMPTDQPQIFHATIQVLAGGCTPLDQRDVLILVPPSDIVIN
ncbi:MAG: hypothetical protein QM831_33015 [Kofleriaceae bacterium]